ncbi:hypothetical protein H5J24_21680 [Chryseobacterium capnotolerans]|uniref:hypothetical protein n=1 Tax=Chryseobacterium capnotolerans TaxID=2759528 RepID=UPI001E62EFA7|nr:hypothetical protein [Chryseobacterium capnotolerans]UHO38144.1 hypothetical protein H5J24_21680 [Chryseobacterium capnotolerans]
MNQTSEEKKQEINVELYDKISICVDQVIEYKKNGDIGLFIESFKKLKEIALECDNIDEITDILLYERIYAAHSKEYSEFFSDITIPQMYGKSKKKIFNILKTPYLLRTAVKRSKLWLSISK